MPRANRVQLNSFKVNPRLADFLKQRSKTHSNGFTGICEECLERGASLIGYEPENSSELDDTLERLSGKLTDRFIAKLKERGIDLGD